MLDILNSKKLIRANIKLLASDYREKTGKIVCTSCPSDVQYMVLTLKKIYNMSNFVFTADLTQYKIVKGGKVNISNDNLTDELAIEFLRGRPMRISLFSIFPENWVEMVEDGLTEEEINKIQPELEEAINSLLEDSEKVEVKNLKENETEKGQGGSKDGQGFDKLSEKDDNESEDLTGFDTDNDIDSSTDAVANAEAKAIADYNANLATKLNVNGVKEVTEKGEVVDISGDDDDCCKDAEKPCEECIEKKTNKLMSMKVKELKDAYPDLTYGFGMKKADFVKLILSA